MLSRRTRILLTLESHRKEIDMDSIDKSITIIAVAGVVLALTLVARFAYVDYLRAQVLANSPDLLAAACAFDASGHEMPPSCIAYLFPSQKDSIR
jgi:hypothetical protein